MSMLTRYCFSIGVGAFVMASMPSAGIAQTNDQPGLLSGADELIRFDQPTLWVLPPYQCFETHQPLVAEHDDRLVEDSKFLPLHSVA